MFAVTHDSRYFHYPGIFVPEQWLSPDCTDIKETSQPFARLRVRFTLSHHVVEGSNVGTVSFTSICSSLSRPLRQGVDKGRGREKLDFVQTECKFGISGNEEEYKPRVPSIVHFDKPTWTQPRADFHRSCLVSLYRIGSVEARPMAPVVSLVPSNVVYPVGSLALANQDRLS